MLLPQNIQRPVAADGEQPLSQVPVDRIAGPMRTASRTSPEPRRARFPHRAAGARRRASAALQSGPPRLGPTTRARGSAFSTSPCSEGDRSPFTLLDVRAVGFLEDRRKESRGHRSGFGPIPLKERQSDEASALPTEPDRPLSQRFIALSTALRLKSNLRDEFLALRGLFQIQAMAGDKMWGLGSSWRSGQALGAGRGPGGVDLSSGRRPGPPGLPAFQPGPLRP